LFAGSSFAGSGMMATCGEYSEATRLLGTSLYTSAGVYIGDVNDLAIDPTTGHIDSVLVGRIPGVGAREAWIPFADISENGENNFVYNPHQDFDWPSVGYWGQPAYTAYRFYDLPGMPQGDERFTTFAGSSVQSMEGEGCGS